MLTANSTGDYAVQSCLRKWGLQKSDVSIKSMGQAEIISAMSSGNADLGGMWAPKIYTLEEKASGKLIFVLPGIPREMTSIFTEEIEPEYLSGGSAAVVRELRFSFAVEARFYPMMRELEQSFPDVAIGSYPNFETKELVIRCAGADVRRVEAALEEMRRRAEQLGFTAAAR